MAVVNGVYNGRSAWSPTYTAYPEYKYVESFICQSSDPE